MSNMRVLRWMAQKKSKGCTVVAITPDQRYIEPDSMQAAPLFSSIIWFFGLLVWPVFLWFFSKRPDVKQHIGVLIEVSARILEFK